MITLQVEKFGFTGAFAQSPPHAEWAKFVLGNALNVTTVPAGKSAEHVPWNCDAQKIPEGLLLRNPPGAPDPAVGVRLTESVNEVVVAIPVNVYVILGLAGSFV